MPSSLSLAQLATARILIDRFSADALGLARYLAQHGARHVRVVDADPLPAALQEPAAALRALGVSLSPQTDPATLAGEYDLIFADLFQPPVRPFLQAARARGVLVTNHADLILQRSPLPAIGITGSAGKSSATLLVAAALRTAGQPVCLGRDSVMENLWPNYEVLAQLDGLRPPGWLLLELTSSHLEYMHASPHIAVVTVLWPDHVDWHGSLERYFAAKRVILEHQTADDWAILNAADARQRSDFASAARGRLAWFSCTQAVAPGVFVRGDQIVARWQDREFPIAPLAAVTVPPVYLANILAGAVAALAAGVPVEALAAAIAAYRGLPHRLEAAGNFHGVPVYADGMAITPSKARAGLEAFPDRSLVLIAGGHTASDYSEGLHSSPEERAQVIAACEAAARKARQVVLFGEAAPRLRAEWLAAGRAAAEAHLVPDLRAATAAALALAAPPDNILFAPIFFVWPDERFVLNQVLREHLAAE
jgi:UDP-N-acetylmuramoylalanine--D-glutamate ligase